MSITINTPPELLYKLAPETVPGAIGRGLDNAGARVQAFMQVYPATRRQAQPPKTDLQRRFIHWAVRNGVVGIPYGRTGALAAGWQVEASGNVRTILNENDHADIVQGPGQAGYHSGNWRTVDDGAEMAGPVLAEEMESAISEVLG